MLKIQKRYLKLRYSLSLQNNNIHYNPKKNSQRSPDNLQQRRLLLERQKEALTTALAKAIEEKKEVQKKLQESTQKFNALLEAQDQLDAEAETFKNVQSNENKE